MYYSKLNSRGNHVSIIILLLLLTSVFAPAIVKALNDPPTWQDQDQTSDDISVGENNILYAQGKATQGLDYAWLSTNETGTWKNYTSIKTPPPGWWNTAWNKRIKLTLNNGGQAENLLDFPLLVVLSSSRINYGDFKSDGTDVRFVDSDGASLNYHIEKWDASGNSYIWVKVPQIDSGSSSDYIWLYYSNSAATSVLNSQGTYDSNFVGVWHLNGSGTAKDSTSNGNNGTPMNHATLTAASIIDGGYSLDGSDDYINVPSSTSLDLIGADFTLEAWAKFDVINNGRLISRNQISTSSVYQLIIDQANKKWGLHVREGGTDRLCHLSTALVSAGTWYYAVATVKKVGTDYSGSKLYVNGAELAISLSAGTIYPGGTTTDLQLGRRPDGFPTTNLDGIEDEVRISNIFRSAAWVRASYLTGTDAYITYSSPETYGGGPTPEFYGSPMKLSGMDTWVWSNFTWNNASVAPGKVVAWKIYYNDTVGQESGTNVLNFRVLAPVSPLIHTTYQDFIAGTRTDTYVSDDTGGEVMLNPTLADLFPGPTLNTALWNCTIGQPPGLATYSPSITNGIVRLDNPGNLDGGGVRMLSWTWFTPPVTIEGRVNLTSSGGNKHFGFYNWTGPDDQFVTISATGTATSTRVKLPGYSFAEVPISFSVNEFHTLKIEYGIATIKFYVDGVQKDTRTGTFSKALPIMFGAYDASATPAIYADWIRIDDFRVTTGSFTSSVLDAGRALSFDRITWGANTPTGTDLQIETRSSLDRVTWSEWSAATNDSQVPSPYGRYIQYSVDLSSTSSQSSPALQYLKITTKARPAVRIESCDESGIKKDQFNLDEKIHVYGRGYWPNTDYTLYIVNDVTTWTNGMSIPTPRIKTTTVHSDAYGRISTTKVWDPPVPGKYDIIVDTANSGVYDMGIDALDDNDIVTTAGLFVIPEYALGTILALTVCFAGIAVYRKSKYNKRRDT